jgi:hypothetical protein
MLVGMVVVVVDCSPVTQLEGIEHVPKVVLQFIVLDVVC